MGYYSIYRIIKDIIRTLFGSKFLKIILILLIILMFLFNFTTVFGATTQVVNVEEYLIERQKNYQNVFALFSMRAYAGNTSLWTSLYDNFWKNCLSGSFYVRTNVFADEGQNRRYTFQVFNYLTNGRDTKTTNTTIGGVSYPTVTTAYDCTQLYYLYDAGVEPNTWSFAELPNSVWRLSDVQVGIVSEGILQFNSLLASNSVGGSSTDYTALLNAMQATLNSMEGDLLGVQDAISQSNSLLEEISSKLDNSSGQYNQQLQNITSSIDNLKEEQERNTEAVQKVEQAVDSVNNTITETSDKLFSDDYDESQIQISTDESDNVDDSNISNFVTAILQNIQNISTGDWNSVETVTIPLRFC